MINTEAMPFIDIFVPERDEYMLWVTTVDESEPVDRAKLFKFKLRNDYLVVNGVRLDLRLAAEGYNKLEA